MEALNLNIELESKDDMDVIISEMLEREEFICTGDACAAHACGIYSVQRENKMDIKLNKSIYEELENEAELDKVLSELEERDELLCTGYACGADASFIQLAVH